MRTEADLIAAFEELEQHAPDPARVLREIRAATAPGRARRRKRVNRWALGGIAMGAACGGIAVALALTLLGGGTASRPTRSALGQTGTQATTPPANTKPPGHRRVLHSAREVLMLAAAHVSTARTSGNYWHLNAVWGTVEPGGTKAHPYNIVWRAPTQVWFAKATGVINWELSDASWFHHAEPLTPADKAAWQAAGSPRGWYHNSAYHGAFFSRIAPVKQSYTWSVSNGVLGYTESDLNGLDATQFAQLPASVAGLRRYLFGVANSFAIVKHDPREAEEFVWAEALNLLVDPVSGQVKASAYRVMAALPGVRLLGLIRDPFGRQGYGLRMDGFTLYGSTGELGAIINPATGTLLDTSYHDDLRGVNYGSRICHGRGPEGTGAAAFNRWIKQHCQFIVTYYGRPYSGLLDNYKAFFGANWVNKLPHVPPATQANKGFVFFSGD
jgi:hypothetical protein